MLSRFSAILNSAVNACRPGFLPVMLRKLVLRIADYSLSNRRLEAHRWCEKEAESPDAFMDETDPELASESRRIAEQIAHLAESKLIPYGIRDHIATGSHCALLYFLTRWVKPFTVVETGVAAGFSSTAILTALQANNRGRLYSSDFPYFRQKDPERLIGILVPDQLRLRWSLFVRGDEQNLRAILTQCSDVELFHYDSDKSYLGRRLATTLVGPRLTPNALYLMDDIQDNFFFRDYVKSMRIPYRVFGYEGKFLGAVGLGRAIARQPESSLPF